MFDGVVVDVEVEVVMLKVVLFDLLLRYKVVR